MLKVKNIAIFMLQLFVLWAINEFGFIVVEFFNLPIPGNVIGMVVLFLLLITGVIKLDWINEASSFLLRHLVFFFIPIAVGVMTLGALFLESGLYLVIILVVSASVGMIVTGMVSQFLATKKEV